MLGCEFIWHHRYGKTLDDTINRWYCTNMLSGTHILQRDEMQFEIPNANSFRDFDLIPSSEIQK